MIRVELHIGSTVYRFASETLDYQGYIWEARVNNPVELQRLFSFTDKTGNRKRTISLTLDNQDDFFNGIHTTYSLLNKRIVVYFDDGSNLTKKMVGHTTEILNFNRTLNLNLSEYDNLYFEQPVPDLQLAYDYYSEGGFNENWNAIPIILGRAKRLKVAWVDKVNFRFMISSGENYKIEKVYFDKQVMYDSALAINGYKATPESQNIKVRVYHGSQNEVVDSIASAYPNLSYIEFYDEATGLAIEPLMTDGKVPEIYVDVQGVINDARSGCERNPARLLYKLMSYPTTGYNGWGMGVPATDLSFNEAIGWCEINQIYIDGVIDKRLNASDWIDELCRHFAAALVEDSGVLTLVIDKPVNVTTCEFDESGELGYHCNLDGWNEPALEAQINRLRLFYRYNYEFSNFDKKPDFNEESPCASTELKDTDHYTKIGQWNTATLELPFFYDDKPAHKIAIQYLKRDILQLKTIQFVTSVDIPTILDVKHKIKVTSARFGWTQKEFLIKEIVKGEKNTRIVAREYDATVYESTLDLTPVVYVKVEYGKYDIPLKPTTFVVTQSNTPKNDGTLQTVLAMSAVKLATNIKNLLFYRKKQGETSWQYFASTETNALNYLWDREDGDYYLRVVSQTPYGVCSDIEIASGDTHYYGQPGTEGKITVFTNYTTVAAPLTAPTLGVYMKTVRVEINQTPGTSKDLVAFQIWRSETADSGTATKVGEVACQGWGTQVIHLDDSTSYGKTYYYWVKAVNSSGYVSAFSPMSAAIATEKIANVDLGPLSVDLAQICTNAIRECHIYAGAVTALKIGVCQLYACHVGTNELIANSANIKDLVVSSAKISSLVADKIDTGVIAVGRNIGSSNYVAGSSGWNIHGNGTAEFSNVTVRGVVCASSGCFNGAVTATSGTFTGVVCASSGIFNGIVCASSGCFNGAVTATSGTFTGVVCASSGCFTGNITANGSGQIGGWNISSNSISGTNTALYSGACPHLVFYNYPSGYDYLTIGKYLYSGSTESWHTGSGISYVDYYGNLAFELSSTRKVIGGWNFTNTLFYSGLAGISSDATCPAFWAGCATGGSARFRACHDGNIYINNVGATSSPFVYLENTTNTAANCPILKLVSLASQALYAWSSYCTAIFACAGNFAIEGNSAGYTGVKGVAALSVGVYGYGAQSCGVVGSSPVACGVVGLADCYGVHGSATVTANGCFGVYGAACVAYGVFGTTAGNIGVYGSAGGIYGGYFTSTTLPSLYAANGACIAICTVSPVYCIGSAKSTKHDYTPITGIMDNLRKLPVEAFKRYSDPESRWEIGTYAECFQKEFPGLGDGKGLSLNTMIGLTMKGLQEVDERLSKIEDKFKVNEKDKLTT